MRIVTVVGARPQFIKAAAVSRAIGRHNSTASAEDRIEELIVHTGQHYDSNMSQVFFDQLRIPKPKYNLGIGSGTHAQQTGAMLGHIGEVLEQEKPDWVLIYGDTNSTLAGALAAVKLHIPVAHVEAGLRSFNRRMPEEINRLVADCVSTALLCPTTKAVENLAREGVTRGVANIGDVMFDSVLFNTVLAEEREDVLQRLQLSPKSYCLATVHRAENTDDPERLKGIFAAFAEARTALVVPLHPRTQKIMRSLSMKPAANVRILEPVSYLETLLLEKNARVLLTDSGGMQKEAYFFNVPCITLREETEWVELVEAGANRLAGAEKQRILDAFAWAETWKPSPASAMWYGDGHASEKVIGYLLAHGKSPIK